MFATACGSARQECRKQFTCRVGTVFEDCKVPLHKCLQAVYLMTASKKGVSSHQLHGILEVTYKTAWFLAHRIREAMRDGTLASMGGDKVVEIDERIVGKVQGAPKRMMRGGSQCALKADFADHQTVNHMEDEYGRGDVTTNTSTATARFSRAA